MLSALLRSGDIKDYTALGQDGMAVYTVASQLRDAIKFKRGKIFADYLAIPKRNDQGNKIDWYVPFESTRPDGQYLIIPWTSASSEEREAALAELNVFERTILELGKELAAAPSAKGDQLLFARLLCGGDPNNLEDGENLKALRFPNPEHVYLVNDRPVITFWGFIEKHSAAKGSPFLSLKPVSPPQPTPISSGVAAPVTAPVVAASAHPCKRFWWILPLLLLLFGFLAWFFRDLWWPKAEVTLNLNNTSVPTVQTTEQDKLVDEKIVPAKDCEERRVEGKSYYYLQQQWVDSEGKRIENQPLLTKINKTSAFGVIQCERIALPSNTVNSVAGVAGNAVNTSGVSNLNGTLPAADANGMGNTDMLDNTKTVDNPVADNANLADNANVDNKQESALPSQDPQNGTDNGLPPQNQATPNADEKAGDAKNANGVQPPVDPKMDESVAQPNNNVNNGADNGVNNGLNIPAESLKNGNLDFLNGKWRAGAGIQDKTTGKPLRLEYAFSDGVGQVKLARGDGVQCVGDVNAKMQGGGLNLNSAGVAKCTDGSTYQLPTVSCKPGAKSAADCQGSYGSGQRFPISMKAN